MERKEASEVTFSRRCSDRAVVGTSGRRRAIVEATVSGGVGATEQLREPARRRHEQAAVLAMAVQGRGRGLARAVARTTDHMP